MTKQQILNKSAESNSMSASEQRTLNRVANLVICLSTIPMAVVIATRWGSNYFPVHDVAVINIRLRDVFTTHSPLVGVYSQFGWNHPGPVLYWLLTPFMLIARGHAWGMIVGSAVIQGFVIAATLLIVKKSAGPVWAIAWAATISFAYMPMGSWILLEAWNPHIAYPFFILFIALAWRCAIEPEAYLPWVVIVGSILMQLHIGYVPLVTIAIVWLGYIIIRSPRLGKELPGKPAFVKSAVSLFVLWIAPVAEAIAHRGGNFRAIVGYFVLAKTRDPIAGPVMSGKLIAEVFRVPPPWLGGSENLDPVTKNAFGSSVLWLLIPGIIIAIGVAIYRLCRPEIKRLLALSWLMLSSGAFALTMLRGKVSPYLFYWRHVLAIVIVLATVASTYSLFIHRLHPKVRTACAVLLIAPILLGSARLSFDVLDAPRSVMQFEPIARDLAAQIHDVNGPVIIRWIGSPLGGIEAGVVNELDRRKLPVGVDEGSGFQWGYQREIPLAKAAQVWFVSERGFATAKLELMPGATVIARTSPLSEADDARLNRLQKLATDQLDSMKRSDVIQQLDSPLAYFTMEKLGVLTESERREFFDLSEEVEKSDGLRTAIISFKPDDLPTNDQIKALQ